MLVLSSVASTSNHGNSNYSHKINVCCGDVEVHVMRQLCMGACVELRSIVSLGRSFSNVEAGRYRRVLEAAAYIF